MVRITMGSIAFRCGQCIRTALEEAQVIDSQPTNQLSSTDIQCLYQTSHTVDHHYPIPNSPMHGLEIEYEQVIVRQKPSLLGADTTMSRITFELQLQ
jgi:hypothetical protein